MAVTLHREDPTVSQLPPVGPRSAPRLVVKNTPIETSFVKPGAKITARSDNYYACQEPSREEFFKGTYKRRFVQLNQCGFHGVSSRPYKDLGQVELNDGRLILDGLGQSSSQEQMPEQANRSSPHRPLSPSHFTSPYKVKLRAKTPSQFPSELANLDTALCQGDSRLESIRRGRGLFELMEKHEALKRDREAEQVKLAEEGARNEWIEAELPSQVSLTQEQEDRIKEQALQLPNISENPPPTAAGQTLEPTTDQLGSDEESQLSQSAGWGAWSYVYNQPRPGDLQLTLEDIKERSDLGEASQPQPHSQCTEEVEGWYRMLCVLVWVLEAMRMESPHHMTPFHKCWNREQPPPNESLGKRVYDLNKSQLNKWEKLQKQDKAIHRMRSSVRASVFLQRISPFRLSTPKKMVTTQLDDHDEKEEHVKFTDAKPRVPSGRASQLEEDRKMMKQRKLTPLQTENLLTLLEEELNYSKKQSRNRINEIIKQADEKRHIIVPPERSLQLPPLPRLDVGEMVTEFVESEERREMIAHEQLTAMERDRSKALHQRFSSLRVSGNLWHDLFVMREGVQIETTSMARRKLLMNYEWFPELRSMLPEPVQRVPKCSKLLATLEDLAEYMCEVGPRRMSRRKLIQFLTQRVIYIVEKDYTKWLEQHTLAFKKKT
ncbi:uncharacterized protein LOC135331774 isoform X2 [Halichondria panicea]|uniref:uncharacterized protein LOC135331774 isoform X2 n=1 Tax=Halichondria panicea TaxID=6063 RepID=UPI00312BB8A2